MSNLRTDYKDDVFTGSRKYNIVNNPDGTVSFTDETDYVQQGDTYGAAQINELDDIVNNLDSKAFLTDGTSENALADSDYFPFYDVSAGTGKTTLWSNMKNIIKTICAIKVHSSTAAATYGAGTNTQFGHVKLSDSYLSSGGSASSSIGASSGAVYSAYTKLNNQLKANNNEIYMDYQNGKYGYNTSASRGADTFHPFRGYEYLGQGTNFNVSSYPGYQNFTVDNFIVEPVGNVSASCYWTQGSLCYAEVDGHINKGYNPNTGTFSANFSGTLYGGNQDYPETGSRAGYSLVVKCWLINA